MTTETLNSLPKDMIEHALMDGAYGINLIRYIEIPLCGRALSNIFRIIWSVGWSAIIAAEMLGVQSGMGYRLLDFRYLLRYREMFIYIGIIGLIGIVTDYLLLACFKIEYHLPEVLWVFRGLALLDILLSGFLSVWWRIPSQLSHSMLQAQLSLPELLIFGKELSRLSIKRWAS
jgi:hypothetical protein